MCCDQCATSRKGDVVNIAQIKAAVPGEILRDDQVTGLHLRVFENRKSFYLYFRTKAGKERRPKIGDYGNITLDQARRAARDMLFKVSLGEDPILERKETHQAAATVADVWPRYWSEHAEDKKTASEDKRIFEKHFPDWFKNLPVDAIAYPEVYRLHEGMKSIPYQANRTVALVSKFLRLCEQWGLRPIGSNPCQHVKRYKEQKRRRYMSSEEAEKLASILHRKKATDPGSVAFIFLLILTGARSGEIANAKWRDLQDNKLILKSHKTDHTGHDRIIYLPSVAMEILETLPRRGPNTSITGIKSPKRLWDTTRLEAGCPDLRLHDLRHSFASVAISEGYTLSQIGELLGHRSEGTTKRYAHLMDEAATKAAETVAGSITERLNGKTSP